MSIHSFHEKVEVQETEAAQHQRKKARHIVTRSRQERGSHHRGPRWPRFRKQGISQPAGTSAAPRYMTRLSLCRKLTFPKRVDSDFSWPNTTVSMATPFADVISTQPWGSSSNFKWGVSVRSFVVLDRGRKQALRIVCRTQCLAGRALSLGVGRQRASDPQAVHGRRDAGVGAPPPHAHACAL